ncbi:MAG: L,D-transpeptidase family protein [Nocardioidaceae bacterium]
MKRTASPTVMLLALGLLSLGGATVAAPAAGQSAGSAAAHPATSLAPGAYRGIPLAARVGAPPGVNQLITVTSPAWSDTHATLKAWRRDANRQWVKVHGPVSVVLGYNGWVKAADLRQGTGTTPAGRFRLPIAFGGLPDPGTRLTFHHVDGNDWWPYEPRDPATYNIYQFHKAARTHWRPTYAEHLAGYPEQYALAIVVGFNLPSGIHYSRTHRQLVATKRADTTKGGGIFLHVKGDGDTAGCVAMRRSHVRWLLRWLRPRLHPRIAMGPTRYVETLGSPP